MECAAAGGGAAVDRFVADYAVHLTGAMGRQPTYQSTPTS